MKYNTFRYSTLVLALATFGTSTSAFAQTFNSETLNSNSNLSGGAQVGDTTPAPMPMAQSQSILRFKDNMLAVIDPSAGPFVDATQGANYEYTVYSYDKELAAGKALALGSNYLFMDDGRLFTTNVYGTLVPKGVMNFKPAVVGATWFSKSTSNGAAGEIVTIDKNGFYYEKGTTLPAVRLVGGNFFITKDGKLNTVTADGFLFQMDCTGCDLTTSTRAGGNYFVTPSGKVVTISSENGGPYPPYMIEGKVVKLGGNFFITDKNQLFGISRQGWIQKPVTVSKPVAMVGYSLVVFADGTFLVVDSDGIAHAEMIRTSTTGKWTVTKSLNTTLIDLIKPTFLNP